MCNLSVNELAAKKVLGKLALANWPWQIGSQQIGPLADLVANWAPHFLVPWQIRPWQIGTLARQIGPLQIGPLVRMDIWIDLIYVYRKCQCALGKSAFQIEAH